MLLIAALLFSLDVQVFETYSGAQSTYSDTKNTFLWQKS